MRDHEAFRCPALITNRERISHRGVPCQTRVILTLRHGNDTLPMETPIFRPRDGRLDLTLRPLPRHRDRFNVTQWKATVRSTVPFKGSRSAPGRHDPNSLVFPRNDRGTSNAIPVRWNGGKQTATLARPVFAGRCPGAHSRFTPTARPTHGDWKVDPLFFPGCRSGGSLACHHAGSCGDWDRTSNGRGRPASGVHEFDQFDPPTRHD